MSHKSPPYVSTFCALQGCNLEATIFVLGVVSYRKNVYLHDGNSYFDFESEERIKERDRESLREREREEVTLGRKLSSYENQTLATAISFNLTMKSYPPIVLCHHQCKSHAQSKQN